MIQDFRYAFRMLLKNPAFTLVAVVSLALGAGANSAMFSLADALLLRPLPVLRPSEVVTVSSRMPKEPADDFSYADYRDVRDHSKTLHDMVAFNLMSFGYASTPDAQPKVKYGLLTTGNLFQAMGVTPQLGRAFRPDEDKVPGRDAVVVLGHSFWMDELGGDKAVLGKIVRLNGIDFTVIGVAPEEFTGMDQYFKSALFVPTAMFGRLTGQTKADALERRDDRRFTVKGRLQSGFGLGQAQAELADLAKGLEETYPATNHDQTFQVRTELKARIDRSPPDAALVAMLMTLAAAVLLVSCLNVANLLLSRARARGREVAVRLAMGAGRFRLVRQLLSESLLIALCGSACGLVFAYAAISMFRRFRMPSDMPFAFKVDMDYRVLAFTLGASLIAVLLFGLAPALQISRPDLVPALKSADADSSGKRRLWGRNLLVVGQVAISLMMLVVSGALYHGFNRLLGHGVGWRTNHLLMMSFDPRLVRYTEPQTQEFYRRLAERAMSAPGVKSAALTSVIPMAPNQDMQTFVPEGYELPKDKQTLSAFSDTVTEHFFETMGITLVSGRGFLASDNATSPKVVIVNEALAKKYWPGKDPIGKRIRLDTDQTRWAEVVGVAKTAKYLWIAEPPLDYMYLPYAQTTPRRMTLIAQSTGSSASLMEPLRDVVRSLDSNLPTYDVRTMEEFFQVRAVNTPNMILNTIGAMGISGLVLSMVGLYGLVAYSVSRRTREFGIRMAIGASSMSVSRMVLRQGLMLALSGIGIGLLLALAADRGVKAVFYSASTDWMAFLLAPLALLTMTAMAAYGPARRASRIDPMTALRYE
jgi:macrolide transport system ATP-binding/permease protein